MTDTNRASPTGIARRDFMIAGAGAATLAAGPCGCRLRSGAGGTGACHSARRREAGKRPGRAAWRRAADRHRSAARAERARPADAARAWQGLLPARA